MPSEPSFWAHVFFLGRRGRSSVPWPFWAELVVVHDVDAPWWFLMYDDDRDDDLIHPNNDL